MRSFISAWFESLAWFAALAMLCASPVCLAQESSRAGKWDLSLQFQYDESQSIDNQQGSHADIESAYGWGFGVDYNLNDHLALGVSFHWHDADYTATVPADITTPAATRTYRGTLETTTTMFNGMWNFSSNDLTPFVLGGLGITWVDTNIPDGPPGTVCWWDPWWGYYCGPVVPTKADNYWTYKVGAGLRWDSKSPFFMRALVSKQWIDVGGGVGTPSFNQIRIDIGTRF
jgi:opacity protein-like surface antigen